MAIWVDEINKMNYWISCSHESSEVRMVDGNEEMAYHDNSCKHLDLDRPWEKKNQNDRRVEGWMKIEFFNLLFFFFIFAAYTNDSTNQLQSSVLFILNLI